MNTENTILNVQLEIEKALDRLSQFESELPDVLKPLVRLAPPKGTRAQVSLRHAKTERQVKRNAPASSWSPDSGLVSIFYNTSPNEADALETPAPDTTLPAVLPQPEHPEDPVQDLLLALAEAEREPQFNFVSLKWFRDVYLPRQGYPWASAPENRQQVLVEAITRKWILTSRVPNPKNPQFPVTAIKVNRPLVDGLKILDQGADSGSAFAPIPIAGEPLSETVLRERR